jgi:hypothetical protein
VVNYASHLQHPALAADGAFAVETHEQYTSSSTVPDAVYGSVAKIDDQEVSK